MYRTNQNKLVEQGSGRSQKHREDMARN